MILALSKFSKSLINTLVNHLPTCLGKENCDLDYFELNRIGNIKYLGIHFNSDMK